MEFLLQPSEISFKQHFKTHLVHFFLLVVINMSNIHVCIFTGERIHPVNSLETIPSSKS